MLGIIGGTSFAGSTLLQGGENRKIISPFGSCVLNITDSMVLLGRHGIEGKTPPHRINHQLHLSALKQVGVTKIISFGSVGSLQPEITPGTLVVPHDWFKPNKIRTFHHETLKFTVPEFDTAWRNKVLGILNNEEFTIREHGVYAETHGPQFETVAEVSFLATVADVVGMTCASEAILANELEIPLVMIAMVDNYANGLGVEQLTGESFHATVKQNRTTIGQVFKLISSL
ncbi:MTAP family purine nucleoside phosphorylase [bacterium]|nr:MTAP family purine nucleoside phosphorylase [bacterium]